LSHFCFHRLQCTLASSLAEAMVEVEEVVEVEVEVVVEAVALPATTRFGSCSGCCWA
jgi:hypothetical protein